MFFQIEHPTMTYNVYDIYKTECRNAATCARVPSHIVERKSINKNHNDYIAERKFSFESPVDLRNRDSGSIETTKHRKKKAEVVTLGERVKKILQKIPAGIGMGEPPVAVAKRPGIIPEKRGAMFSYAAKDLYNKRRSGKSVTKNAKDENWYTEAKDTLVPPTFSQSTSLNWE